MRTITVEVACAQLPARPLAQARAALADILAAIRGAKRAGADLVVLPECSYPGYVLLDPHPYRHRIPDDVQAGRAIAAQARRCAIDVCVGMARRHGPALRNEAVYFDAEGDELGTYAKCRLWNFDTRWFARGRSLPVFQTRFGVVGLMICADGRNPEIARTLVAEGAWLILDPTAWVGSAPSHEELRNPQADYALRARAVENGVWIAAADKCGSELGAVHYAGRSQIVAPDGRMLALAGAARPELIHARIARARRTPFAVALSGRDRRTLRERPARVRQLRRVPPRLWLGVYQSAAGRADDLVALQAIAAQGAHATIRTGQPKAAVARALHRARGLRFSVFEGDEMAAVEPARAAALRGADLLVWLRPPRRQWILDVARTRALENRVYVALASRAGDAAAACVIGPDGAVVGSALARRPSGFVAAIHTIASRRKELVPGTQTFGDRMPNIYRWLDRRDGVLAGRTR